LTRMPFDSTGIGYWRRTERGTEIMIAVDELIPERTQARIAAVPAAKTEARNRSHSLAAELLDRSRHFLQCCVGDAERFPLMPAA
jgi:hypothetical protein